MANVQKSGKTSGPFTAEERSAMKERAQEVRSSARRGRASKADEESALLAKVAEMSETDRAMAEQFHAIVKAGVPELSPTLWYGMPAYAKGGKVICFFQPAQKFKTRYATLGFSADANLDDGSMWPTSYALTVLTADDEARIGALLRKAIS